MNSQDRRLLLIAGASLVALLGLTWVTRGHDPEPVATSIPASTALTLPAVPDETTPPPKAPTVTRSTIDPANDRMMVGLDVKLEVERVARKFVTGWLAPSETEREAILYEVASIDFLPQMMQLPQSVIPQGYLLMIEQSTTDGRAGDVIGRLSDESRFKVHLVLTADGWRVTSLDEA